MKNLIDRGDKVCWPNDNGVVKGFVIDTYNTPLENASVADKRSNEKNRALLIELYDGSKVLKLENEVKKENI